MDSSLGIEVCFTTNQVAASSAPLFHPAATFDGLATSMSRQESPKTKESDFLFTASFVLVLFISSPILFLFLLSFVSPFGSLGFDFSHFSVSLSLSLLPSFPLSLFPVLSTFSMRRRYLPAPNLSVGATQSIRTCYSGRRNLRRSPVFNS